MENNPKLLDQVRIILKTKHYSYRTEKSFINWMRRYIIFHNKQLLYQENGKWKMILENNEFLRISEQGWDGYEQFKGRLKKIFKKEK